MITGIL